MTDWFQLSELASHLQQDVDTSSATLARTSAQNLVLTHTGQLIESGTSTRARLPIQEGLPNAARLGWSQGVELPQRPATAVTEIYANNVLLDADDWVWDGFQTVGLGGLLTGILSVEVTYSHGLTTLPTGVKTCALMAAGRLYRNPDQLQQQTVSDYSVSFVGTQDYSLTPAEVAALPRWLR